MSDEPPRLTAALIVKNEEQHLESCLRSIEAVADEIIVVDTGSSDATPEIAEAHGVVLLHHAWNDDFAEARNVSLDAATGDWILYIDADERLAPIDDDYLLGLLADDDVLAYRILLRPIAGHTPYREYRLWRSRPEIRFEGRIHERVIPSILKASRRERRSIEPANVLLHHVGYEGNQHEKHLRNLPLLRERLAEEPENCFNWHHLWRVLTALDQHDEARAALESGLAMARRTGFDPAGVLLYCDAIHLQLRLDAAAEARALLTEALSRYPRNRVLAFLHGRLSIREGDPLTALSVFDELLATDLESLADDGPSYDARYFGEWAHEARGLALLRLERPADAADAYRAALDLAPDNLEYRTKHALALGQSSR